MIKLLLLIGVIYAVYFIFFKKKSLSHSDSDELKGSDMVECASCGVYSQLDESFLRNGKYYCSKECMEKA